jgi:hypothetical protein
MSKSDFSVVLNSLAGAGTNNNNLLYSLDFAPLDKGLYEVSFSFVSGLNNVDCTPAIITTTFGSSKSYTANQSLQLQNNNYLGVLYPVILSAGRGYLEAKANENPPVLIELSNASYTFSVVIQTLSLVPWVDSVAGNLLNYSLILHFKRVNT